MGEDLPTKPTPGTDRLLPALLGAGLLLRLLIAWAPFSYLAARGPLIDDAFYSLGIARNLAGGHGLTADGVHQTSGFQPLYTFLLVPFYLLSKSDPILPMRSALTLLALAGTATGWFLFRITRRLAGAGAALFSLALWSFSPYFLTQGMNGLETGLFGLFFAAALDLHLGAARNPASARPLVLLGVVLAGLVLARVDGIILAVVLLLDLLREGSSFRRRFARAATVLSITSLLALPYFVFLRARFGSFLPESGAATRFISLCYGTLFVANPQVLSYFPPDQAPWSYYAASLGKAAGTLASEPLLFPASLPVALLGPISETWPAAVGAAGFLALLANLLLIFLGARSTPLESPLREYGRIALPTTLLWIPAYAFVALGQWWFSRYFFPLFLLMLPLSGLAFRRIGERLTLFRGMRPASYAALAFGLQLLLFAWQVPGALFTHRPNLNVSSFLRMRSILDEAIPPEATAGAFQSGTLSYFSDRTVINLDGVVNGAALRALEEKRMAEYVRGAGIQAVIDYPLILQALLVRRSPAGEARRLGEVRQVGPFYLVRIASPGRSAPAPPAADLPGGRP
ncbi:MAG TPA: glycosyltransferase family 39 protein [Candidatus Polarisedimenticolia bacterium]|jgi:hypothetical protein|nr:glycosyltransferase family 39 protein [Candidatus Polarisedimenticolia bacterium]